MNSEELFVELITLITLPYYNFSDYYVPRLYQALLATILAIITEVFSSTFTEDFK